MPKLIQACYDRGVYLPEIDLWLDPNGKRSLAFVSHAHADHFARHGTIICSERTHDLIRARYHLSKQAQVIALPYGEVHALDDQHEVRLLPAGHIFGSAQIHITRKTDGATLLYTGDFKLRESHSCETIEARQADTLIMETTFGLPQFRFPPTREVIADIVRFCRQTLEDGDIPIIIGYSLGKAQEILAVLSGTGLPLMVHKTVDEMAAVYQQFQQQFPPYSLLDIAQAQGHVLVMPPAAVRSQAVQQLSNRRTAMLSGWAIQVNARYRYSADRVFPLSDHADYPDLMKYVTWVMPKCVWTLHGYAREFARDLREQGIEAWSILSDNQMDLSLGPVVEMASSATEHRTEPDRVACQAAEFTAVCEAVRCGESRLEEISILADYLASLETLDLRRAVRILSCRDTGTLRQSVAIVGRVLLHISGLNPSRYRELALSTGSFGRTAGHVLRGLTTAEALSLADLERFQLSWQGAPGPLAKHALLADQLGKLHPSEACLLVQILTNEISVIVPEELLEEAIATSFARSLQSVRRSHRLSGDLGVTAIAAREGALETVCLQPFTPVVGVVVDQRESPDQLWNQFASGSPPAVWLEDHCEGIRVQLHRAGGRAALFAEDRRSLDDEFPELLVLANKGLTDDVVLDGVLIVYAAGKRLRLIDLRKRLHRKRWQPDLFWGEAAPVRFVAVDVLWMNGRSLIEYPWLKRRRMIESVEWPAHFEQVNATPVMSSGEIAQAFRMARAGGKAGGVIVKDGSSPYLLGLD